MVMAYKFVDFSGLRKWALSFLLSAPPPAPFDAAAFVIAAENDCLIAYTVRYDYTIQRLIITTAITFHNINNLQPKN